MYQLPHYSSALSAYLANASHHHHHSFVAAAAAAAAVVSQTNPFSIDNILASRPRLYDPSLGNTNQSAVDFYGESLYYFSLSLDWS